MPFHAIPHAIPCHSTCTSAIPHKAQANYLTRIGDKVGFYSAFLLSLIIKWQERSLVAQKLALEKTPGLGSRIRIVLTLVTSPIYRMRTFIGLFCVVPAP